MELSPKKISTLVLIIFTLLFCKISSAETSPLKEQLLALDNSHQEFSDRFIKKIIKQSSWQQLTFNTLAALQREIKKSQTKNDTIRSILLIVNNLSLIKNNYDDPLYFDYLALLLDNNIFISAQQLQQTIKREGDSLLNEQSDYLFADYYFKRRNWAFTQQYLVDELRGISPEKYAHTLLMKGIILQKLSNHRDAILFYERVPKNSSYYPSAQLNLAIANIKQGWWSQGHIIIKNLLKDPAVISDKALANRLYVTLGYSEVNKAYYRHARGNFQKITIDSPYANQGIIGLALTAAQQDDFIGALNATRILKAKNEDDLAVDEANLLMPFFYEKTMQTTTAENGYRAATLYFEKKIAVLKTITKQPIDFTSNSFVIDDRQRTEITINEITLNMSASYPVYFFLLQQNLLAYQQWLNTLADDSNKTIKLNHAYQALIQEYQEISQKMVTEITNEKIAQLSSYLNQAKFGLARIYDNNTVEQ